ncbi:bifunctional diguanylate cyclase/phosphodiesterase [Mariprofundus ferrooxydans]|nr:bifunctional diguanylate cyclase/phosphodiesterase [Mariprofundus ferrooxydans]
MSCLTEIEFDIQLSVNIIAYHKVLGLAQALCIDEVSAESLAKAVATHCLSDEVAHICCTIHNKEGACQLLVQVRRGEQKWQEQVQFSHTVDVAVVEQQQKALPDMSQTALLQLLHNRQEDTSQQRDQWKQQVGQLSLELERQRHAMQHQFMHDALTGLPNKRLLASRLEQLFKLATRQKMVCSLLIMDINNFKHVNDTLGHQAGDLVLREVAERLGCSLRASDVLARLGGDEFVILLFNNDAQEAEKVAIKLQQSLNQPLECEGSVLSLEASIGISEFPDHGDNLNDLMRRADVAMHYAKKRDLKTAIYNVMQDKNSVERMSLLKELTHAIKSDGMELYYQPQVQMDGHERLSVEALIRWNHPQRGMVFPDQFIPLAEDSGLIIPMTWWVLKTAMKQCVKWHKSALPVNVSVNISANFLQEENLVQRVTKLVNKYQLPNHVFALEITENTLMDDPHQASKTLIELNKMHIDVSIDDFGTGYSSLAYLKHLEVDELKIDRSFIMGMNEYKNDSVIVHTVINMAHSMGLRVVAEGVETRDDWDRLAEMGCDFIQGYLISRPKPVDEISEWLRNFYEHGVQWD